MNTRRATKQVVPADVAERHIRPIANNGSYSKRLNQRLSPRACSARPENACLSSPGVLTVLRENQARGLVSAGEIETFRIEPGHAPRPCGPAQELGGVEATTSPCGPRSRAPPPPLPPRRGRGPSRHPAAGRRGEVDNPAEPRHEMRVQGLEPLEREILEAGINLRLRVAGEEPPLRSLGFPACCAVALTADARMQPADRPRRSRKTGSRPRVRLDIARMHREARDQDDGRAIDVGGGRHQRGVGPPVLRSSVARLANRATRASRRASAAASKGFPLRPVRLAIRLAAIPRSYAPGSARRIEAAKAILSYSAHSAAFRSLPRGGTPWQHLHWDARRSSRATQP